MLSYFYFFCAACGHSSICLFNLNVIELNEHVENEIGTKIENDGNYENDEMNQINEMIMVCGRFYSLLFFLFSLMRRTR